MIHALIELLFIQRRKKAPACGASCEWMDLCHFEVGAGAASVARDVGAVVPVLAADALIILGA